MLALIQRVTSSKVEVQGNIVGSIGKGLIAFIGLEKADTEADVRRLCEKLLGYRIFSDQDNKMNLSLKDVDGGLLLVPQFTLAADTNKGMRPFFSSAATPDLSRQLFNYLCTHAKQQ